ncbi:hypothetical protein Tco_0426300 [Tanacetum coccineum]
MLGITLEYLRIDVYRSVWVVEKFLWIWLGACFDCRQPFREEKEILVKGLIAPRAHEEGRQRISRVYEVASSLMLKNGKRYKLEFKLMKKKEQLRGYSFDEIKTLFETTMRSVNTFVPIKSEVDRAVPELAAGSLKRAAEEELDQESSNRQKTDESSKLAEEPRDKEADELSQEELQQMMIIVSEQGMNVEALQTKNHTEVHHFFDDMLKAFDMDDLVMMWSLVKEKFNSTELTDDKEREIWVDASCVYKEGNRHLHAGREGVSIVKGNSYIDAGRKALGGSR